MEFNEMLDNLVEEPVEVMAEVTKPGNGVLKNVVGGVAVYAASLLAHKYVIKPLVHKIKDKRDQSKVEDYTEQMENAEEVEVVDEDVVDEK